MKTELSVREFACRQGVSLRAIYDKLAVGRIAGAQKVGRRWVIPVIVSGVGGATAGPAARDPHPQNQARRD